MRVESIELGANEFCGVASRYDVLNEKNQIYAPGAFAACSGKEIMLFWDHQILIGRARLYDTPDAVLAHGRINCIFVTGNRVLRLLRVFPELELCILSATLQTCSGRLADSGQPVQIVTQADALNVALVLSGGIAGCGITRIGEISLPEDLKDFGPWDLEFLKGSAVIAKERAVNLKLMARESEERAASVKIDARDYEQWLENIRL
jgi:hypothetical protein